MLLVLTATLAVLALAAESRPRAPRVRHTIRGDVRKHPSFPSQLVPPRDVLVYLPPGYEGGTRRYPVLYLQDGQNLFDGATSFIPGQEWRVDETAERLIRRGSIEPLIIVGIYNAGELRADEYTPTPDPRAKAGGKADVYGRFLVEEVMPFIDARYRTLGGTANTGVGGSSLGGLVSLHLAVEYPHVFGKVAVLSPSVWWDGRSILERARRLKPHRDLRVWLDMGTKEGEGALRDARLLRDVLRASGLRPGRELKYFEARGAPHSELAWAKRVGPVLRFLFPARS
jgi:predicted alpha/beta superfamily hydrolase